MRIEQERTDAILRSCEAGEAHCKEAQSAALTTDDSNFGGRNRKLSALAFPSNVGVWLAPQALR